MHQSVLRVTAWLIPSAAIVMSVVPPELRPMTGMSHVLEHFIWFFVCGIIFATEWPKAKLSVYVAGVTFCGVVELVQLWVPGRHARLSDFLVDACATAAGISLTRIIRNVRSSLRPAVSD
jgi:VanZ family protein